MGEIAVATPQDKRRGVTAANGTTKAAIERAALLLFAQSGVDAVTTREIAAAAGVSEGALYRHYQGKEALAGAMFFAIHKRLAAEIRAAAGESDSLETQARAVVAAYCRIADEDWSLFAYHLLTTHRFLPLPGDTRHDEPDNPVSAVEDIIAGAMQRGELTQGDNVLPAAMALGVMLQTALHKVYGRISGDLSPRGDALSNAVIAVLNSSAAAGAIL